MTTAPLMTADLRYERPRLSWIKKRARRLIRCYGVQRRLAICDAAYDYGQFVGARRAALTLISTATPSGSTMKPYLITIVMHDGSTGEHHGLYPDGLDAAAAAVCHFPEAKRIHAARLPS